MKKITLTVLALLIALPLFAGDADGASVELNGSATTTFGVDLDSGATGFQNSVTAEIQFHFNVPTTATKSGMDMGTIYGEILLDEILVDNVQSADSSEVYWDVDIAVDYAKIMGNNWWISVVGPDATIDYENALQNGIIGIAAAWDKQMDSVSNVVASSGGFEAGFSVPDVAAIELSLFSITDWTATTDAEKNAYGFKAAVALNAVENLTLEAAVNMGFGDNLVGSDATDAVYGWIDPATGDAVTDDTSTTPTWGVVTAATADSALNTDMGIGGKLAYAIAVGDITITPEIAADVRMVTAGTDIAIGNGLRVAMPGSEITAAEDGVKTDAGTSVAWDDGVNSGLTLGWDYYMPADGSDASLGIQAHYGLSSVENFQLAVGFEAADLMAASTTMGMAVYTQYTMGDIKPWGGFFMEFDGGQMIANAGLTWSNIVPLTTLTVIWRSGDLAATEADLGILTAAVKVAY